MTTQDEQSFLNAIYANPHDDTPRLVFADWLDERGADDDKARAALIRAQCQAEYLAPGSKERKRLEREAKALIKVNEKRWLKDIRAAKLGTDHTFRRGFLDGVTISPTRFVERGADLFRIATTLRTVKFPNAANELTELAESPFLARLANVDLTRMCTCGYCGIDEELRDLFKSKHAKSLRSLNVSRDRIDAEVAQALARSTNLANLTTLDLSDNPLGGAGLAALAKSKHLGKLTALNLSRVATVLADEGLAGFREFAKSKHFPSLKRLVLTANVINPPGVKALVAAPFFKQLTHLDLSSNRIGEQGAKALAGAEFTNLESLDLSGSQLGPRAIKWLKAKFGKRVKV
jgi:uncharacterized protein (TIGR02996 family)